MGCPTRSGRRFELTSLLALHSVSACKGVRCVSIRWCSEGVCFHEDLVKESEVLFPSPRSSRCIPEGPKWRQKGKTEASNNRNACRCIHQPSNCPLYVEAPCQNLCDHDMHHECHGFPFDAECSKCSSNVSMHGQNRWISYQVFWRALGNDGCVKFNRAILILWDETQHAHDD
eukprot:4281320-Karenia_brevis.AAC.1